MQRKISPLASSKVKPAPRKHTISYDVRLARARLRLAKLKAELKKLN